MNASWDERDEVISAEDGEQALRYAREMQPDLVLLDLLLPKMTGTEVLARLKNEAATALIPVVVVSGLSERNRQKLIDAGADDYLEKSALMPDKGSISYPSCLSTSFAGSTGGAGHRSRRCPRPSSARLGRAAEHFGRKRPDAQS